MKAKASDDIRAGWLVTLAVRLDGSLAISPYISGFSLNEEVVGMAARDMIKGETINYEPGANTSDILSHISCCVDIRSK